MPSGILNQPRRCQDETSVKLGIASLPRENVIFWPEVSPLLFPTISPTIWKSCCKNTKEAPRVIVWRHERSWSHQSSLFLFVWLFNVLLGGGHTTRPGCSGRGERDVIPLSQRWIIVIPLVLSNRKTKRRGVTWAHVNAQESRIKRAEG